MKTETWVCSKFNREIRWAVHAPNGTLVCTSFWRSGAVRAALTEAARRQVKVRIVDGEPNDDDCGEEDDWSEEDEY